MGEKKYKKELNRKKKVKEDKKAKLSEQQVDTALANIEILENRRRVALNKYLEDNNFIRVEPLADQKKNRSLAVFLLKRTRYILEKVNLSQKMTDTLQDEMEKLTWLYQITDEKTRKKWQIFQINFLEDTNDFNIVKLMDGKDIKPKKK